MTIITIKCYYKDWEISILYSKRGADPVETF